MKRLYLDSGALIKLYVIEPGSEAVQDVVGDTSQFPLNPLQETEVRTALHAAVGRNLLDEAAADRALAFFDSDIRDGRWIREEPDWVGAWQLTQTLSNLHVRATLCRTLDILHVALAQIGRVDRLITGDKRQADVCRRLHFPFDWITDV